MIFKRLMDKVNLYHPSDDVSMIKKAYDLAYEAHKNQLRKSGEPYIIHPLEVACILADLELDKESIVAGILHDVIEDTAYTFEEISDMFSEEVALLVDGVTKLGQIQYSSSNKEAQKEEAQAENYRKMFLAMAQDIRVVLIKLADRLHNMLTLKYMSPEKQIEKAEETLHIYAPLAHRLGISKIKAELEDLALRYLEKDVYYDLVHKIAKKRGERIEYIDAIIEEIKEKLKEAGVHASVEGRPKHFFSIYKKIINQNKTLDQIYDLFAVRAIVDNVKDCYGALGVVHEMYKPIPGRFKDYIAMPKPNMYQSLHTTLMGPEGTPFELQIRTEDMHRTAEYGIAAHWKYKDGNQETGQDQSEEKLAWLRQILEWQRDMTDNQEFMDAIKLDLDVYTDQVYVFTPTGDLMTLPLGSTPIDFAYNIHSAVGNMMVGAKANGRIVTFDYIIKNGDRLEIMTSQNSKGPSRDWLKIVKSSQARTKINQWFRKQFKEENIIRGKEMLEQYAKKKGYNLNELVTDKTTKAVLRKNGLTSWDSLCATVGHGGIKEGQIVQKLIEEYEKGKPKQLPDKLTIDNKESKRKNASSKSGIIVKGVGDLAVRFSKCCNPVPGDEIVGYITKGRGVSIHRTDCVNMIHLPEDERQRLIESEWQYECRLDDRTYVTEIQVRSVDRMGIIVDISKVLTDMGIHVKTLNARSTKDNEAIFNIKIEICNVEQLDLIIHKLLQIQDIIEIIRASS